MNINIPMNHDKVFEVVVNGDFALGSENGSYLATQNFSNLGMYSYYTQLVNDSAVPGHDLFNDMITVRFTELTRCDFYVIYTCSDLNLNYNSIRAIAGVDWTSNSIPGVNDYIVPDQDTLTVNITITVNPTY